MKHLPIYISVGLLLILVGIFLNDYRLNEIEEIKEDCEFRLDNNKKEYIKYTEEIKKEYEENLSFYLLNIKKLEEKVNRSRFLDFSPSIQEVKKILEEDNTDELRYHEYNFNCADFSYRLVNRFLDEGIFSCIVEIDFEDGFAHSVVSINTSDKGLIFIESQDDTILYDLNIGEDYCEVVGWACEDESVITHIKSCFNK